MINSPKRAIEVYEDLMTQIDIRESQVEGGWDGDHKEDFDDMREFVDISYPLFMKWLHEHIEEERVKALKAEAYAKVPKVIVATERKYWEFFGSVEEAEAKAIEKYNQLEQNERYVCMYGITEDNTGRLATYRYITMYNGNWRRGAERFLHWETFQRFFSKEDDSSSNSEE